MSQKGTFIPGVRGGDVRFERHQAAIIQSFSKLPKKPLDGIVVCSFKGWIGRRLAALVGFDDEVLVETVVNTLEERTIIEAGEIKLMLVPFMGKESSEIFVGELWEWMDKARATESGIPKEFEEEYKQMKEIEKQEEMERRKKLLTNNNRSGNRGGSNRGMGRNERVEGRSPRVPREPRNRSKTPPRKRRDISSDSDRSRTPPRHSHSHNRRSPRRNNRRILSKSPPRSSRHRSRSRSIERSPPRNTLHQRPPTPEIATILRSHTPSSESSSYSDSADGESEHETNIIPPTQNAKPDEDQDEEALRLRERVRRLINQD